MKLSVKDILHQLKEKIPDNPSYDELRDKVKGALIVLSRPENIRNYQHMDVELSNLKDINENFLRLRKRKALELDYKDILSNMLNEQFKELNEANREVAETIENLRTTKIQLEVELNEEKKLLLDAEKEHEQILKDRKEMVAPIEGKLQDLQEAIFKREIKYRIILQLLRDGYLKDPTFDLIQTIQRHPEISTIERLAQVSNVNPASIRSIFRSLQNRNILTWDMNKESFHLKMETEV